jgi:hypothetical protein
LLLYLYKKYPIVFGAILIEIEIRLPGAKNSTTTTKQNKTTKHNTNVYSHIK